MNLMGGEMKKRGEGEGKCKNLGSNYTGSNMVNFHPQCGGFPFSLKNSPL